MTTSPTTDPWGSADHDPLHIPQPPTPDELITTERALLLARADIAEALAYTGPIRRSYAQSAAHYAATVLRAAGATEQHQELATHYLAGAEALSHPRTTSPTPASTTYRRRPHMSNAENMYTDWDIVIDTHRGELITSLNTALGALTQAASAIAALTSDRIYDVEFAEGAAGPDVAAFVADSLRLTRAAYTLTREVTERS